MLFDTNDGISLGIRRDGVWIKQLVDISRLFYADIEEPLVIDIGANLGGYLLPIAKELALVGGCVYAFEPQRIIYYQLCCNIFLNRLDNVYAYCTALGDHDGTLQLPSIDYQQSTNIGAFSIDAVIRDRQNGVKIDESKIEPEVPIAKLDSLYFPKSPCLIKIDVEGLELQVLKGGAQFLAKHNFPPLMLEAWTGDWFAAERQKLLDYLEELGYTVFAAKEELFAQHPQHPLQIEFSIVDSVIFFHRVR